MFDPYVAILDEKRFELATNDDTALALQDGFVSIIAPADGKYLHRSSRERLRGGQQLSSARRHLPATQVRFPAGGKMGEEVEVRFLACHRASLFARSSCPPRQ